MTSPLQCSRFCSVNRPENESLGILLEVIKPERALTVALSSHKKCRREPVGAVSDLQEVRHIAKARSHPRELAGSVPTFEHELDMAAHGAFNPMHVTAEFV